MKNIIRQYEQDWLGSRPIFYNTKTLNVSYNINEVIDYSDIELHPEGFNNYLDFGYSVFEQTAIKNVKFIRYSSTLRIYDDNSFEIEYLRDPVDSWFGKTTNEADVLELLRSKITDWEKSVNGEIVLPLSGGFDSRLLASMITDKSRLRCFTYGISHNQSESHEVVHAKKIVEILHLTWKQIELGYFHKYIDDWYRLFGVSVHAHGMYHIEFYKKILENYTGAMNFLSGIFGDVWAGNIKKQTIHSLTDIIKLGYTHGDNASSKYSLLQHDDTILSSFYKENKEKLQFEFYQIITTIRLKIILISYLITVPESFGFSVFTPYLDMEIALSMLCLPPKRRENREWQREYFQKCGLDVENMRLICTRENTLDYDASHLVKLPQLQARFYKSCIKSKYIDKINTLYSKKSYQTIFEQKLEKRIGEKLCSPYSNRLFKFLHVKGIIRWLLKIIGYKNETEYRQLFLEKFCAYRTLKPYEILSGKAKKC